MPDNQNNELSRNQWAKLQSSPRKAYKQRNGWDGLQWACAEGCVCAFRCQYRGTWYFYTVPLLIHSHRTDLVPGSLCLVKYKLTWKRCHCCAWWTKRKKKEKHTYSLQMSKTVRFAPYCSAACGDRRAPHALPAGSKDTGRCQTSWNLMDINPQ